MPLFMELKGSLRFHKSPPPAPRPEPFWCTPTHPTVQDSLPCYSPIQLTSSKCPLTLLSYNWNFLLISHALMRFACPDQIAILQRNKCSAESTDYKACIK